MAKQNAAMAKVVAGESPHPDGRKERSRSSRGKIVQAMIDLVADGDPNPSAAKVAETAGVGLRSVFRHFDDKDSIFKEMNSLLMEAYLPRINAPYQSEHWKEQLIELVERRAGINEESAVFRIPSIIRRHGSKQLKENYKALVDLERRKLHEILPGHVRKDKHRARSLLLATSFDAWRLFRQDEGLSNAKTIEVMRQHLQGILDQIGD